MDCSTTANYTTSRQSLRIILFVPLIISSFSFFSYPGIIVINDEKSSNIIQLQEWLIFEKNSSNFNDLSSTGGKWIKAESPADIYKKSIRQTTWIKTKLPSWKGNHPTIYIGQVDYFMQVFLKDTMIYETGERDASYFIGRNQNLIPIQNYKPGDELLICLRTGEYSQMFNRKILLGSSVDIIREIFLGDLNNLIFAMLFIAAGIIFAIFIPPLKQINLLPGVALYLISLGGIVIGNSPVFQLLLNAPRVLYNLSFIALLFSPAPVLFSIEQIAALKFKRLINALWKVQLVFLIFCTIIINTTSIHFFDLVEEYLFLILVNIIICSVVLFKSINESKYEVKILMLGMAGFFFFIFLQVLLYIINDLENNFGNNLTFLYLGVTVLIISMLWVGVDNYVRTNKENESMRQIELEAVKHENEVRRYFAARLLESQENERNRIALELHDSVGQKLLLIKNHLLNIIKLEKEGSGKSLTFISGLAGELIHEIRDIIYNLRPQHLDQLGLKTAIETMLEKVSGSSDIEFNINIDDIDGILPKGDEICFYRIIQESLNNIVKHSHAAAATVTLKKEVNAMLLEISDNGKGFNPGSISTNSGLGLTGIRERSRLLGADLNITSNPGSGTFIRLKYMVNNKPVGTNE